MTELLWLPRERYRFSGSQAIGKRQEGRRRAQKQSRGFVRWCVQRDLPQIIAIDMESYPSPWTDGQFRHCLRQRNICCQVSELGDLVTGFVVYMLHRSFIEILKVAVIPEFRRRGMGTALVQRLQAKLGSHERQAVLVNVPERDLGACLFLRCNGFRAVRVLRGWCDVSGDDAYRMRYDIEGSVS